MADANPVREHAGGKMLEGREGAVGIVTFNQPEKRNAMSIEMWQGLADILDGFARDESIRVVVLQGAGGKAFVSGADISQFEKHRSNAEAQKIYAERTKAGRERLEAFPKPTIACIQGWCVGGGLAIAMGADLRIASAESRFGIPAARLGIAYGFESLRHLVELVGPAHARMIMYTAEMIGAEEAARIGLINRVLPAEELWAGVMAVANRIAENAPLSIAASKLGIEQVLKDPAERDMAAVARIGAACMDSADYREGRTAFMEKRTPRFTGR